MRSVAALLLLILPLSGCVFDPFQEPPAPFLRVDFTVQPYASDDDGKTDGIRLHLLTAGLSNPGDNPSTVAPFVGHEVRLLRNGDHNVTVFRDAARLRHPGTSSVGAWNTSDTLYILGFKGVNLVTVNLSKTVTYKNEPLDLFIERNFTVLVEELRDTEVDGTLDVRAYDRDGNNVDDGFIMQLFASTKAPFQADEIEVRINNIPRIIYEDSTQTREHLGELDNGEPFYVDGVRGENRIEVMIRATPKFDGRVTLTE